MGLSDDQRALLRLLAQREEGYEDIAALKGLSVEQVRAEVRQALAALQAADEPPPPPAPPPVEEPPPPPVEEKPKVETPPPPAAEPEQPAKPATGKPRPGVPVERRRFLLLAGGAVAIVAVVLGAIAIFGDSSGSAPNPAATDTVGTEVAAGEEDKVTQAVLSAADGSDASGRAVFGRVGQEEIVLQVTAENLEPTAKGESYTVWLYRNPKLTLRVGSVPVGEEGRLGARFAIPAELLAYVASGAFNQIYISRTENAAYQREVARAKQNKSLPRYIGDTVLTGEITGPITKTEK
ncbi:MAG: anti-sigma factor [Solirubrobacterales bacterium]